MPTSCPVGHTLANKALTAPGFHATAYQALCTWSGLENILVKSDKAQITLESVAIASARAGQSGWHRLGVFFDYYQPYQRV